MALFITLCALSKAEVGAMLIISFSIAIILSKLCNPGLLKNAKPFVSLVAGPIALSGAIYGYFLITSGAALRHNNMPDLLAANIHIGNTFTSWLAGTDSLMANLHLMARSLVGYLFFGSLFLVGGHLLEKIKALRTKGLRWLLSLLVGMVVLVAAAFFQKYLFPPELQYRCLPIFLLGMIIVAGIESVKPGQNVKHLRILVLYLFSLLISLRMLLNLHPAHYGFYLLVPGIIAYHLFIFKILPLITKKKMIQKTIVIGFGLILITLACGHFQISRYAYSLRTLRISAPRGDLLVFRTNRDMLCAQLIEFLRKNTPSQATLAIFPEGLTINFLSERSNPLYYYSFLPVDLPRESLEDDVVSDMEKKKIDYVVLLQRPLEEYGRHAFGMDYGKKIWDYVLKNYSLLKLFGNYPYTTADFGIAVFKRNSL